MPHDTNEYRVVGVGFLLLGGQFFLLDEWKTAPITWGDEITTPSPGFFFVRWFLVSLSGPDDKGDTPCADGTRGWVL